jgi:hypothetical protein
VTELQQDYEIEQAETEPPLTNKQKIAKAKRDAKQATKDRHLFMFEAMKLELGRGFFEWLLDQCGSLRLPLNYPKAGEPVDVNATMVNIGMAAVGNRVISELLVACPDQYTEMLKERAERSAEAKNG